MIKRLFDIIVSAICLLSLVPVIFLIAFQVYRKLGSPVFFYQFRAGKNAKPFRIIKFRTMHEGADQYGSPLPDSERITAFGKFLRNSSLDELPGLWNVFKGDMSLVGPRPLLMEYLPLYSPEQARRHNVRPGITGWAQVNGRNAISWEDKFQYDLWYLENQSFLFDMKIILMTIEKVIVREGISADGEATMPKFTGNKEQ
jgi:lipopolysaccharide/colanic/teichoic acid biosynthesis glycosyltransferase